MKQLVFDINEMSDSKEIYGQRPSPIFAVFIYTIVGLLAAALLYACLGKIEIVATAAGIIRPNEDVGTVSCLRSGAVTQVNCHNGQAVHAGDILFAVDTAELQIQLDSLQKTKLDYQQQIDMLDKFLVGIEAGENPFSLEPGNAEYSYYIQFEDYLLQLENTQHSFDHDVDKTNSNLNTAYRQLDQIEAQIAGWTSYKDSIQQGTNLAGEYPEYERMYLLYVSDQDALRRDHEAQRKQIEATASADQLDALLTELEASYKATCEQEYYQTIIQIDNTIRSLQAELTSVKASLKQNQIVKDLYDKNTGEDGQALTVSMTITGQISSLLSQQDSLRTQLQEVEAQILQVEEQIKQGLVTAQCDGTVSLVQPIVAGDILSAGSVIATIVPTNEDIYKVQLYVNNADIGDLEIGDVVRCDIMALPSNQYGTVNGAVTGISADALIQEGQYSGYYLVECSIEKTTLTDRDGNTGTLCAGMQLEGRIVTQEKTILRHLLEKIDIF